MDGEKLTGESRYPRGNRQSRNTDCLGQLDVGLVNISMSEKSPGLAGARQQPSPETAVGDVTATASGCGTACSCEDLTCARPAKSSPIPGQVSPPGDSICWGLNCVT